jgi:hypothetical protein
MRNFSTLIYFVNRSQSEPLRIQQVETEINSAMENENVPSDRIIENIMNFARSYEVCKTESTGYVEMILN